MVYSDWTSDNKEKKLCMWFVKERFYIIVFRRGWQYTIGFKSFLETHYFFTKFALRQSFFCQKNHTTQPFAFVVIVRFFTWKRLKKFYDAKLIFWSFATFFVLTIFWSGAKQRFCFRESMSVLNQNGRIQALGFLARWWLTSHALYYKIPYSVHHCVPQVRSCY